MPVRDPLQESEFWLASTPASLRVRRLKLVAMAVLFSIFLVAFVFANVPIAQSDGFIPFIQGTMVITELITAVLLYTQFATLRSRAILVLASGYLFTALVIMAHTLSFPRALSPSGLFGGGLQTTGWLHIIWHFVYPASIIGYVLLRNKEADTGGLVHSPASSAIILSVTTVCALALALTWGLVAADAYVPPLILDRTTFAPLAAYTGLLDALVCALALFLLWKHERSFLDQWLLIAVFATILEMAMVTTISGRFTLGWYSVRLFGVIASTVVLIALLVETMVLYARLAKATVLVQRERSLAELARVDRMVTAGALSASIAHEVTQPLAGMVASANAGLRWLSAARPDIDKAQGAFTHIADAGHRANEVIRSVRAIFKTDDRERESIDLNSLISRTLVLIDAELRENAIEIETGFDKRLPPVMGDATQLQQVLLNLMTNSIESMSSIGSLPRKLRLRSEVQSDEEVLISIEDTGVGFKPDHGDIVFKPLFTTKAEGMGLGLAICRSVIEGHGGRIWASSDGYSGAIFQFALPAAASRR
jgi:signal transduction histidine kinase